MYDLLNNILPDSISYAIYRVGHYFPQLIIGFAIIALGLYLIRGKKNDLNEDKTFHSIEDKGGF